MQFRFERKWKKAVLSFKRRVCVGERNALLAAAVAAFGIAQTFAYAAVAALREEQLVELLAR